MQIDYSAVKAFRRAWCDWKHEPEKTRLKRDEHALHAYEAAKHTSAFGETHQLAQQPDERTFKEWAKNNEHLFITEWKDGNFVDYAKLDLLRAGFNAGAATKRESGKPAAFMVTWDKFDTEYFKYESEAYSRMMDLKENGWLNVKITPLYQIEVQEAK